jgi:hypothetical protein
MAEIEEFDLDEALGLRNPYGPFYDCETIPGFDCQY